MRPETVLRCWLEDLQTVEQAPEDVVRIATLLILDLSNSRQRHGERFYRQAVSGLSDLQFLCLVHEISLDDIEIPALYAV